MRLWGIATLCAAFLNASAVCAKDDPRLLEWAAKTVRPHLAKFKKYPPTSKERYEESVVYVGFTINRKGELLQNRIVWDSKFKDLNDAALATVRDAKPFPPFPADIKQDRINLSVPVRFSLIESGVAAFSSLPSPPPSVAPIETKECSALKNTMLPYQVKWKTNGIEMIKQVHRDTSGDFEMWRSSKYPGGKIEIDDIKSFDARGMEGSTTDNQPEGPHNRTMAWVFSGFPEMFDRRSNATYTQRFSMPDDKGVTVETTSTVEYEFIREEKKAFGPCILALVIGRQRYTNDGKPDPWSMMYYLPELRGSYMFPAAKEFELTTNFEQLKHFK